MMTEGQAKNAGLWCVAWGVPRVNGTHMDCPVVVTQESQVVDKLRESLPELPAICMCDCLVCKRHWWDMGRPMFKDGKVVTETGKTIA